MSKTADELRARNREANEYARTFNKIALMHGHDLPMALLGELIALFDMALAPSVDKPTASAEVVSPTSQDQKHQEDTRVDEHTVIPPERATASSHETTPTTNQPIAVRYFESVGTHGVLETDVEDALIAAMGVDLSGPPDEWKWPFSGWCFDWHDDSFELHGTKPGWAPTSEQLAAAWALGFGRCWICYTDGMERYAGRGGELGPPNQRGVKDVRGNYERIKRLEKQLAALTASAEVVSPTSQDQKHQEDTRVDEQTVIPPERATAASDTAIRALWERVGVAADSADNFYNGPRLQPRLEADCLRHGMHQLRDELRTIVIEATGENPWNSGK